MIASSFAKGCLVALGWLLCGDERPEIRGFEIPLFEEKLVISAVTESVDIVIPAPKMEYFLSTPYSRDADTLHLYPSDKMRLAIWADDSMSLLHLVNHRFFVVWGTVLSQDYTVVPGGKFICWRRPCVFDGYAGFDKISPLVSSNVLHNCAVNKDVGFKLDVCCDCLIAGQTTETVRYDGQEGRSGGSDNTIVFIYDMDSKKPNVWTDAVAFAVGLVSVLVLSAYVSIKLKIK